jgi:DNA-binding NarL/FixJ family response regulator
VHETIRRLDAHEDPQTTTAQSEPGVGLTGRQHEVLCLMVAGFGNREIAARLGISTKTAMHHTTAIYRTLGVRGRSEAIALALRTGLVE